VIPSPTSALLPLALAALLAFGLRFHQRRVRIVIAVSAVVTLVALSILPSPALSTMLTKPAGWILVLMTAVQFLAAQRVQLDHKWRHAILGGALLGGFATAAAILSTSQDRAHGARLATLAWVAGVCSPLGGLGTVATWSNPTWPLLSLPLLVVCALLLRSRSRTAAIPPEFHLDRLSPSVIGVFICLLVLGGGGAWHLAAWIGEETPLAVYGLTLAGSALVDPAVLALSGDHILGFHPFGHTRGELAVWLGLTCTPVPVLVLLFSRFGGNAVRDAKHVLIPVVVGLVVAIAMTTST
jgi:hypothetical protein